MDDIISEYSNDFKVLYVEDNEIVRKSTMYILEEFFNNIDTAENGRVGLAKYEAFYKEHHCYYDIVITDINMPEMNGIAMSKAIYHLNNEQHIIVISAHNESHYLIELINIGISNFILKPMNINHLEQVIFRVSDIISNKKRVVRHHEEIHKINESLQKAKEKADKSSQYKSQFLANMSHEIRTPLNAISGFIGVLHDEETNVEKLKYYKIIQNASVLLTTIINDVLDFSKIESGKLELELVNFNPYEDILLTVELFKIQALEKKINFTIFYNENMPKLLNSDIYKIKQVFTNLLSNAIKFTPEGSKIKCMIWYMNGKLNIRVKDYGIGIPKEKVKLIFESFSQVDSSVVRKYGGTGLGLSISSKLADLLGGDLTFTTSKEGSIFTFSIPVSVGTESKELNKESTLPEEILKSAHILLVEDNEANRMFVGIVLKKAGFTYENANDGLEAIEKFKAGKFDLILMDENMPNLGGIMATKEILALEKENKVKHTPIIALTANASTSDESRFIEAGMDAYLSKPITPAVLTKSIRKFLLL